MIDWLKFRVPYAATGIVPAGHMIKIAPDGELIYDIATRHELRGSFDQNMLVWCDSHTGELMIDGNAVKWHQGHNLFGTERLLELVIATFEAVAQIIGLNDTQEAIDRMMHGEGEAYRVDLTRMYDLGTLASVNHALSALEQHVVTGGRGSVRARAISDHGTLYWRKHSRRYAWKAYGKYREIQRPGHRLHDKLQCREKLNEYALPMLRLELVERHMDLVRIGLSKLGDWCDTTCDTLFRERLSVLEFPETMELTSDTLSELPGRLQLAYSAWKSGEDLRLTLSRPTFFRYRAELLKHGVDISVRQPSQPKTNVVPFVRVIELREAKVPSWAIGTPLYFDPPSIRRA